MPMKNAKNILIPLAPGFEEIEALTVVDILRRAGANVVTAGTVAGPIEGRNGIKVLPDAALDDIKEAVFDVLVLPGGAKGTENLKKDKRVLDIARSFNADKRLIAAICAAPTVLSKAGITKGRTVTAYPGVRHELKDALLSDERVFIDNNIITSQSPGTAMEFAFAIVMVLYGEEKVKEINKSVLAWVT